MSNIIKLTKVLFKTSGFSTDSLKIGNKKKTSKIGMFFLALLLIYSFGVLASMIYFMSKGIIDGFNTYRIPYVSLELLLLFASIIILFFAIFMVPTVFYFSDDVQGLLPLPLKPYEILASKFIVTLIYEYATVALIYIPMIVAFVQIVEVNVLFFIQAIVLGLVLPIIPLLVATLLIMVLMRFSKIMRNRDRFNLLAGTFYIVLCLGISMFSSSIDQDAAVNFVNSLVSNKEVIGTISKFIPSIGLAIKGMANQDIVSFIISVIIPIACFIVVLFISNKLYFGGVIGINEMSSKRKKLSERYANKALRSKGVLFTYTKKEISLLLRTPVYFMNCILGNFMLIIMFIIMYGSFALSAEEELKDLANSLPKMIQSIEFNYQRIEIVLLGLIISIGVGMMTSGMNTIACTAISREGSNIAFMKSIPVKYRIQIDAKVLSSVIITNLGSLPILIALVILLNMPIYYYLIAVIGSLIGSLFMGYFGILIDVFNPKLSWDNEKVAVKNNLNSIISVLLSMSLVIGVGFLIIYFDIDLLIGMIAILILVVGVTLGIYVVIPKFTEKKFYDL